MKGIVPIALGFLVASTSVDLLAADTARADALIAEQARELYMSGVQAFSRKDYEEARSNFARSAALVPRGVAYRNLAAAEWALHQPLAALLHLKEAMHRGDLPSDELPLVQEDWARVYGATGHLSIKADPGAHLRVDGSEIGEGPLVPVDVAAGGHGVESFVHGALVAHAEVDAKPGVVTEVAVRAPPPALTTPALTSGATGSASHQAPTVHEPDATPSSGAPRRTIGWIALGVGVLSLGGSAFFWKQNDDAQSEANTSRQNPSGQCTSAPNSAPCALLHDAYDKEQTAGVWSAVLLGVGAAAAVTGIAMVVWPDTPNVNMAVGSTAGGLQWRVEGKF